ncbi:hypothetical protein C7A10_17100 [Pseudomonas fluorescens]|uniref:Uncharacterized protein n=1 Tax=Pseudomonas fluorescens TaxID=294 RepID=A0A2T0I616_PSEFL|nr:hypothetical protein C7A10_17100 [Pseudomonas fluorescens]
MASELARAGVRSAPAFIGAAAQPGASKLARHRLLMPSSHSGTGIALSIHHPENRSIRYPPTQSRPHKKVRTRPVGTFSHGLIKTCVFLSGSATQSHTGH